MRERILALRKSLSLSQEAFGKRIKISGASVSKIESGENNPSDQTLALICREFNVSYEWLTEGKGRMYLDIEESDADRFAKLMRGESENKKQLFRIVADMPDELLEKMVEYLESKFK